MHQIVQKMPVSYWKNTKRGVEEFAFWPTYVSRRVTRSLPCFPSRCRNLVSPSKLVPCACEGVWDRESLSPGTCGSNGICEGFSAFAPFFSGWRNGCGQRVEGHNSLRSTESGLFNVQISVVAFFLLLNSTQIRWNKCEGIIDKSWLIQVRLSTVAFRCSRVRSWYIEYLRAIEVSYIVSTLTTICIKLKLHLPICDIVLDLEALTGAVVITVSAHNEPSGGQRSQSQCSTWVRVVHFIL